MKDIKVRVLSVTIAAITTVSTVFSAGMPIYAENNTANIADDDTVTKITTSTDTDKNETSLLFINMLTSGGAAILDEGEDNEQSVRLEKQTDEMKIDVYDKDGLLISSENAEDNGYMYVYEAEADNVVNIKATADDGYVVKTYEVSEDVEGTDVPDDVGFKAGVSDFNYPVFMDTDKTLKVEFTKKADVEEDINVKEPEEDLSVKEPDEDLSVETPDEDLTVKTPDEDLTVNEANENDEDLTVKKTTEGEDKIEEAEEQTTEFESEESSDDLSVNNVNDITNIDADDSSNVQDITVQDDEESEHFLESTADAYDVDKSQFASARLVIIANDSDIIIDKEHMIANYDTLYIMQYKTVEQSINAYEYYLTHAEAVEPDAVMETAGSENTETVPVEESEVVVNEEQNPIDALSENQDSEAAQKSDNVIALIDTGASESSNVIDRISLIDDVLEGNGHGNDMVKAIVSQNPDAKILSIRAMGNDGRGTVSSIVAAIEYAINQKVSIINMSLYAKLNAANSVLETEIKKAVDAGIIVVGAAGNDGKDAIDYMPGSVDAAYIIGACDETGTRLEGSNYGDTVDYNIQASTTSEAAAKFSGYISKYGVDNIIADENDMVDLSGNTSEESGKTDTDDNSKIEIIDGIEYDKSVDDDDFDEDIQDGDSDFDISDYEDDDNDDGFEEDLRQIGDYPTENSINRKNITIWTRDTEFDFASYNPYDSNVSVQCLTNLDDIQYKSGESFVVTYIYTLIDTPDYSWRDIVTFTFNGDRYLANAGSGLADKLLPSYINQNRNEGYTGIVPKYMGETVEGRTYTAIKDSEGFDLEGIVLDYNPHTFKINKIADDGGFDIHTPGNYTVIYEMSYFMYFDYTWFVKINVNVVDPDSLDPGIYVTSLDSTVMMNKVSDGTYGGYGDLWKAEPDDYKYLVSCFDDEYELGVLSSDDSITDIWSITDSENNKKELTVNLQDNLDKAIILSLIRPNYKSAKMLTGGGWQTPALSESRLSQFTEEQFAQYEDEMSGEKESDEYLSIAADWVTKASTSFDSVVVAGPQNVTNYGWDYHFAGCNYGTARASTIASSIAAYAEKNGYYVLKDDVKDFYVGCITGHDYMAMAANSTYPCQIEVELQTNGSEKRVMLSAYLHPASDHNGNYQTFYGTKYIGTKLGRLIIKKRFQNGNLADETPRIGNLQTVFGVYTSKSCTKSSQVGTISLNGGDKWNATGSIELTPGNYYVKELYRIGGCALNGEVYGPIPVKTGSDTDVGEYLVSKGLDLKFENLDSDTYIKNRIVYMKGNVTMLTKKNPEGKPVKGAVYRIQYSAYPDDDTHKFKAIRTWFFKTDAKGEIKYDEDHLVKKWKNPRNGKTYTSDALFVRYGDQVPVIPMGALGFKEAEAPKGYEYSTKEYRRKVTFAGEHTSYVGKLTSVVNVKESELVDKWKIQVNAKKVDEKGNGLKGAIFALYSDEACTKPYKDYTLTSEEDGMTNRIIIRNIPDSQESITLYCKEITAPTGYAAADKSYPLTFYKKDYDALYAKDKNTDGELKTFGPEGGIVNESGWQGRVNAKKVTKTLKPLAGAVFGIYKDEACTISAGEDLTSGDDGMTNEASVSAAKDVESMTIYCKEKSAPKGYIASKEVFSVTFNKADYDALPEDENGQKLGELKTFGPEEGIKNDEGKVTPTPTITPPEPGEAGLYVKKTSKAASEIMALRGYSLGGAVFQVTSDRGFSATLTTDETGISNVVSLPDNHTSTWIPPEKDMEGNTIKDGYYQINPVKTVYTVTEITPPKGHKKNNSSQQFSVTMPDDKDRTFKAEFEDDPIFCQDELDVEKLGGEGNPIEGVVFKADFYDDDNAEDDSKLVKTWYLKSDASGHVKLDDAHLATDGNYRSDSFFMHEGKIVLPIDGFLNMTEVQSPAEYILNEKPVKFVTSETGSLKQTYYNEPHSCMITLHKYEDDGSTPIAGVEFELKFIKDTIPMNDRVHPNYARLLKEGETIQLHTNEDGEVIFRNLDQGIYQITEVRTEAGRGLLKEPIIVTLPLTMTDSEVEEYGNVDYSNGKLDQGYTNKWFFYSCSYDITNNAIFVMPTTGGNGVWKYGFLGFGIIAAFATTLIAYDTKKKRKNKRHK